MSDEDAASLKPTTSKTTCPVPEEFQSRNRFIGASFRQLLAHVKQLRDATADFTHINSSIFLVLDERSGTEDTVLVYARDRQELGEPRDPPELREDEDKLYERFGGRYSDGVPAPEPENSLVAYYYIPFRVPFREADGVRVNITDHMGTIPFLAHNTPKGMEHTMSAALAMEQDVIRPSCFVEKDFKTDVELEAFLKKPDPFVHDE